MGRPPDFKRIAKEDFDSEYQTLIDRLAYPINSFIEQTRNLFSNNIDFQNLNQEIIEITMRVNADGNPITANQYRSTLNTRVQGMLCINVQNNTNPGIPPSQAPFATFVQNENIVTISNITGLTENDEYVLRFLTIGL